MYPGTCNKCIRGLSIAESSLFLWSCLLALFLVGWCSLVQAGEVPVVVGWANPQGLGLGRFATRGSPLPPITVASTAAETSSPSFLSPNVTYEDVQLGSNGRWTFASTKDNERGRRYWLWGLFGDSNFATPVDVTNVTAIDQGMRLSNPRAIKEILVVNYTVLMLVDVSNEGNTTSIFELFTWDWSDGVNSWPTPMIGRVYAGTKERETPTAIAFPQMTSVNFGGVACNGFWCHIGIQRVVYTWGVPGTVNASPPWTILEDPVDPDNLSSTTSDVGSQILSITAGPEHVFVATISGIYFGFGANTNNRIDVGPTSNFYRAAQVNSPSSATGLAFLDFACGFSHSLLLVESKLFGWGDSTHGQLLQTTSATSPIELAFPAGHGNPVHVSAIAQTSFLLFPDGVLYAWGDDYATGSPSYYSSGLRGDHGPFSTSVAINVALPSNVSLLDAPRLTQSTFNLLHALSIQVLANISDTDLLQSQKTRNGLGSYQRAPPAQALIAWGQHSALRLDASQVGSASLDNASFVPIINVSVSDLADFVVPSLLDVEGVWTSVAILDQGVIVGNLATHQTAGWGKVRTPNGTGIPIGAWTSSNVNYTSIAGSSWTQIVSHRQGVCLPHYPSLQSITDESSTSMAINSMGPQPNLASCGTFHCVIAKLGTTAAMTWNGITTDTSTANTARLGRGATNLTSPSSVSLSGGSSVQVVSAGHDFTILVRTSGTISGFGNNDLNQLTSAASAPYQTSDVKLDSGEIDLSKTCTQIVSGFSHSLYLNSIGSIYCWGGNKYGQCASDPSLNQTVDKPTLLTGIPSSVLSVAAVRQTSFAILTNGSLLAWGYNGLGNMFGGSVWQSQWQSTFTPLLIDLVPHLRLNYSLTSIASSSFSNLVIAQASLGANSGSINLPPPADEHLVAFGTFGAKPRISISPTDPAAFSFGSHVSTDRILGDIVGDEISLMASSPMTTWIVTKSGRLANFGENPISCGASSMPTTSNSPISLRNRVLYPTTVHQFGTSDPVVDIAAFDGGVLVLQASGSLFWYATCSDTRLSDGSSTSGILMSTPTQKLLATRIGCASDRCCVLEPTRNLRCFGAGFSPFLTAPIQGVSINLNTYDDFVVVNMDAGARTSKILARIGNGFFLLDDSGSVLRNMTGELNVSVHGELLQLISGDDIVMALTQDGSIFEIVEVSSGANSFLQIQPILHSPGSRVTQIAIVDGSKFLVDDANQVYGFGFLPFVPGLASTTMPPLTNISNLRDQSIFHYDEPALLAQIVGPATLRPETTLRIATRSSSLEPDSSQGIVYYAYRSTFTPPPPVAPVAPEAPCNTAPPSANPQWRCLSGTWALVGNVVLPSSNPLVVDGKGGTVQVIGNLTVESNGLVIIAATGQSGPYLNVSDCVTLNGPINVQIGDQDLKNLPTGTRLHLVESNCLSTNPVSSITMKSTKGCREVTSKADQTTDANTGRVTLSAVLHISSSACNRWWIILISVIGGLILIVGVALLVIFKTD